MQMEQSCRGDAILTDSCAEASYIKRAHIAELYHSLGYAVRPDATVKDAWVGSVCW